MYKYINIYNVSIYTLKCVITYYITNYMMFMLGK